MTEKPDWLSSLSKTEGNGSTSADQGTAALTKDVTDLLAKRNKELKDATPLGTASAPYNLSNSTGAATVENTANSYLISAPGHYRIPLVYGNAIENGTTNSRAYISTAPTVMDNGADVVLHNFKDHLGNNITDPWIEKTNSGANAGVDGAKIVWADEANLIHLASTPIVHNGGNAYLEFEVKADDIKSGNTIVAATKGGVVVWSWHLWFAPKSALTKIEVTNYQGIKYNFTNETLGWKPTSWSGTIYNKPRTVKIRIEQAVGNNGIKQKTDITITQKPGNIRTGFATFYQWGRKDAFPGTDKALPQGSFNQDAGDNMSIVNGIQNPQNFYSAFSSWQYPPTGYGYCNLWSTDNSYIGSQGKDDFVRKTIYDPCPVGFKIPASNAFTGFTSNGQNDGTDNVDGTNVPQQFKNNCGHNIWTNNAHTATIFFHVAGVRTHYLCRLLDGYFGAYWTAGKQNIHGALVFSISSDGKLSPLNSSFTANGYTVRPVSEY